MARRRTKRAKKKSTYTVFAPESLGGMPLHDVLATEPEDLIGRTYHPLLYDLTEDLQHQNIVLDLKIDSVQEGIAQSVYAGHHYVREYLRSLVMRGTTLIKGTTEVVTTDGYRYRLTAVAFTIRRINKSKQKAIRKVMFETLRNKADDVDSAALIKEIMFEKVAAEIYGAARKICPLRHVGIMRVKLLEAPETVEEVEAEGSGSGGGEGEEA